MMKYIFMIESLLIEIMLWRSIDHRRQTTDHGPDKFAVDN